ncbi:hypothetical protein M2168_002170 [Streptomyces sp. CZ24]|uniref:DUF1360 domain-containing protein n=1 Tax=Streptomyces albidoflavus TaxID=1886 RepID=UPI000FF1FDA4|nr:MULTISPECIES: DUF1360 domain-containing protein [Streptomyces]MDH6189138.1 hypothetical protein [Streptomyces sp. CZ24]RWZ77853.1 DUF1360 domain-containing protein [Streptomyces albidoflavus]
MISLVVLAFLALAGYRGTQLVVHDSLLDPVRARIDAWQQKRPTSAYREAVVTLISCVYCTGWWVSGALLATWLHVTGTWGDAPILVHGIEWLAVAGGAVLLNRWDDERKADG